MPAHPALARTAIIYARANRTLATQLLALLLVLAARAATTRVQGLLMGNGG